MVMTNYYHFRRSIISRQICKIIILAIRNSFAIERITTEKIKWRLQYFHPVRLAPALCYTTITASITVCPAGALFVNRWNTPKLGCIIRITTVGINDRLYRPVVVYTDPALYVSRSSKVLNNNWSGPPDDIIMPGRGYRYLVTAIRPISLVVVVHLLTIATILLLLVLFGYAENVAATPAQYRHSLCLLLLLTPDYYLPLLSPHQKEPL